jgi:hypothetical protein
LSRARERLDSYTLELQKHGLESVDREVRWLNELIASERQHGSTTSSASTGTTDAPPTTPDPAAQPATTDPSASQHP